MKEVSRNGLCWFGIEEKVAAMDARTCEKVLFDAVCLFSRFPH